MAVRTFGMVDGVRIDEVEIASAAGARASIISWGAVIRDLVVPAPRGEQRVVLGFETMEDYLAHSPHFGAVAGRFANRIAGGRFSIDGRAYDLQRNEGQNTLHGGQAAFGRRPWILADHDAHSARLTLHSPDGDGGFPGAVDVTCVYTFLEPATLRVELVAVTSAPTIVNLAQHSYFNLDGSADILDHEMTIHADFYTPTTPLLVPTGEVLSVAGTPFDFRQPRPVRTLSGQTYDNNFVLSSVTDPNSGLALAARARSAKNGVTLDVWTNQPMLQFYDAPSLNVPVPGLGGVHYGPAAGFCLEAQTAPDSPNHRHFPSAIVRPEAGYRQVTDFRFTAVG